MARALWTGSLSFGLVNVPVQLVSAVRDLDLHFRQIHEKDDTPIETQPRVLEGGQGGPLRGDRQRVRRRRGHRRGAERRRPGEDAHDRHRVLRQARRDRPDLLRPPVLPRPRRRDRRHRARLPAARGRDGAERPGRDRALRAADEGVPRRHPRARQGAHALHACASPTRCARPRASRARVGAPSPRRSRRPSSWSRRSPATGTRPPTRTSTASGCRRSSARSARAARSSCPRPTRSARSRCRT